MFGYRTCVLVLCMAAMLIIPPSRTEAQAPRRDDITIFRFETGTFHADTAHNGGWAEKSIRFGETSAYWPGTITDYPLLGDIDKNGLADPCVFRFEVATFYCDTAHNGGWAETTIRFGETGTGHAGETPDYPLLGDVDGDGRADPCVHRIAQAMFYCDTAHDGGWAEVQYAFGEVSDGDSAGAVAMGDLNNDKRDDICIMRWAGYTSVTVLCDTAHNGGWDELNRSFSAPFGSAHLLIGDTNGDSIDEVCFYVLDEAKFYCDTANNGGGYESVTTFGETNGDFPLIGNLGN